jgi:spermidine synthase
MGKVIFRTEDDMGVIVVSQRGDKRVLSFDSGLEQSSVYLSKPYYLAHEYTQVMLLGLILVDAKHVTLLGLGGGGLAHCLSHYYKELTINVVELRQAVIDIAYEWFDLPRIPQLQVSQDDAQQYLLRTKSASTDIIFSDLYHANGMSELQNQKGFLKNCYKALNRKGWLVLNFHTMPVFESALMQTLRSLFPDIRVCNVIKGNWILICGKTPSPFDEETLTRRAEVLVEQVKMPLMYYYRQLRVFS